VVINQIMLVLVLLAGVEDKETKDFTAMSLTHSANTINWATD
jgi:hypothetical protein